MRASVLSTLLLILAAGPTPSAPLQEGGGPAGAGGIASCIVFVPGEGEDAADALQALIDTSPRRAIFIPDGECVLSHPVATPADPARAVSLRLSDFAVLKAAPGWAHTNAMVRLGGIHPKNDNRSIGSQYGLYGGYIDGSGVADGVSIESGRETRVQGTSIRNVRVGLRVFFGANGGSADCDIRDVNIVGNNAHDSIGLWVQAHDNSFTNMRICDARIGVRVDASGNLFANIHPLCTYGLFKFYDDTIGFLEFDGNNTYDRCYADQFSTGWYFGPKANHSALHAPMCYWYNSTPGHPHTIFKCEGQFKTLVTDLWAGFRDNKATNAVLLVAEPGGHGVIRDMRGIRADSPALNSSADAFRDYLQGAMHK